MSKRLELAEAPVIEVSKKGKIFKIPEIVAEEHVELFQLFDMKDDGMVQRFCEIVFKDAAVAAKETFTLLDLMQILKHLTKEVRSPLEELSAEMKTEGPSPSAESTES